MATRLFLISALLVAALACVSAMPLRVIEKNQRTRLIETAPNKRQWMSEDQFRMFRQATRNFMDVTLHPSIEGEGPAYNGTIPKDLTQEKVVKALTPQLNADKWSETVKYLSEKYINRYYQSDSGAESAVWLSKQFEALKGNRDDVTVKLFPHKWKQSSVIIHIEGKGANKDEVVVLGAQEDSINQFDPTGKAPGADDNATGAAAVLEIFRVLMANNFTSSRSVEFHLYAAEEEGELGSLDIAADYYKRGVIVPSMVNFDMVGYKKPGTNGDVGLVTDGTTPTLNAFLSKAIAAYSSLGVKDTECGYACSDFASWVKYGYAGSFPFEEIFADHSPYIHTVDDTFEHVDPAHALEFCKFGLGYVVEASAYETK